MGNITCGRRTVLGGLIFCAAGGSRLGTPAAQPAGRGAPPQRRVATVVIDPGHGGVDPGAISPSGVYEKDIALATASEFARQLAAKRGFRAVLTRSTDEFLPLRERVARARAWKADLFLSIHADALPNTEMRGLSVFTQSAQASDREAAALAASENRADLLGGVRVARQPRDVGKILLDLTRRQTSNLSIVLARRVVAELSREAVLLENPQRLAACRIPPRSGSCSSGPISRSSPAVSCARSRPISLVMARAELFDPGLRSVAVDKVIRLGLAIRTAAKGRTGYVKYFTHNRVNCV